MVDSNTFIDDNYLSVDNKKIIFNSITNENSNENIITNFIETPKNPSISKIAINDIIEIINPENKSESCNHIYKFKINK
jgi:hypothetical protein